MGKKPTHRVFFVQEIDQPAGEGESKAFWRQIGVAWSHKSGQGFNLKLDLLPADMSAGELVILVATEKPEGESGD